MKKKEFQVNIKLTEKEFQTVQILMKKYSVNISNLLKNSLNKHLEDLKSLEQK